MCFRKMWRFCKVKCQLVSIFILLLLVLVRNEVVAVCVHVDNKDLLQYNCEGGSLEDLKNVPDNVEKIHISNMSVGLLDDKLLSRFYNSLLVLTCSSCSIKDVSDGAFRKLRNLQQLSLDNNHLRRVRASWFQPGLNFLTYLDLNYNQIESLDSELFSMMPSLIDLRLSGNQLECLDLQALSLLHDLKRIFLNENPNFGCPNALSRYLQARGIDYEPDPQWAKQTHDRLRIDEPYSAVDPTLTVPTTAVQSPSTTILSPFSRKFDTSGSSHPSLPNQDVDFNRSVYYEPTVISQKPNNYRNSANLSSHSTQIFSTSPMITTSLPTEPATTKCPNSTTFNGPWSYFVLIIIATTLLGFSSCMWVQR